MCQLQLFYQQTNCSIFSLESLLMQLSMLMCTSFFFIQNSLCVHIFPCSIIMPGPHRIVLVPIRLHFSVRQFFSKIFYVGVYCSLGTDHSNSSMHAKSSTLVSTVPLVLTIQIQACLGQNFYVSVFCSRGMVDWQRWCLLFLWYHTEHLSMHLSWCTTMWQPKSQLINITIKINWL